MAKKRVMPTKGDSKKIKMKKSKTTTMIAKRVIVVTMEEKIMLQMINNFKKIHISHIQLAGI